MIHTRLLNAATAFWAGVAIMSNAMAAEAPASAPVTHGELPELVRKIIMENPTMVIDAAKKFRTDSEEKSRKESKEALAKHEAEIFGDTTSPSIGDPKTANVTMVEFFDYHCGYCKQMLPTIARLTKEDSKLRVIFREFPILSEDSVKASRAALAVYHLDKTKYFPFHTALLTSKDKFDDAMLANTAKSIGIDPDKMKAEMEKPYITEQLDNNRKLAEELGVKGTPAIILPKLLMPGAAPYDDLKQIIEDIRAGKPIPEDPSQIGEKKRKQ